MPSLSKRLFGRKYTLGEWAVVITSFSAGFLTILQNIPINQSLSVGIQDNVTNSPSNLWMLGLGIILIVLIFMYINKTKRK